MITFKDVQTDRRIRLRERSLAFAQQNGATREVARLRRELRELRAQRDATNSRLSAEERNRDERHDARMRTPGGGRGRTWVNGYYRTEGGRRVWVPGYFRAAGANRGASR